MVAATVLGPVVCAAVAALLGATAWMVVLATTLGAVLAAAVLRRTVLLPAAARTARASSRADTLERNLVDERAVRDLQDRLDRALQDSDGEPATLRMGLRAIAELAPDVQVSLLLAVPDEPRVGWRVRLQDGVLDTAEALEGMPACAALARGATASTRSSDALEACAHLQGPIEPVSATCVPMHVAERTFGSVCLEGPPGERPDARDIVVYETIPNDLPRVGGIITTVVQTPLSHVNLRALQNDVPNAFIRNALEDPAVTDLLDQFVYYKVETDRYTIREALPAEVDAHYEALRPDEEQSPVRNLSVRAITPLNDIDFTGHAAFGAKTGNVAVMRDFGFPDGTIPNGFGIPFYFYDEFMKLNGFYDRVETLLADPDFQADFSLQDEALADFRDDIEDGAMPQWMLDELAVMQESFPAGTNIRCRSSTNNEDLPGFSGAGLYESKTHRTTEGHISKTVKEVFASMWAFRAFAEREFYRIDHLKAAMGVLVHPNFKEEKANGVGITGDPIYSTEENYYLNTQVGEDLVTNPEGFSIPEEVLLRKNGSGALGYEIIRRSNLLPNNEQIMTVPYLDELREYMDVIHEEFAVLYEAEGNDRFSIDIEYKIDSTGQLVIKQARPWVGFLEPSATNDPGPERLVIKVFPNPASEAVTALFSEELPTGLTLEVYDVLGRQALSKPIVQRTDRLNIDVTSFEPGVYFIALDQRIFARIVVR